MYLFLKLMVRYMSKTNNAKYCLRGGQIRGKILDTAKESV